MIDRKTIINILIDDILFRDNLTIKDREDIVSLKEELEAINYTRSSTQLKDKNELTFGEWCEVNRYRKTKNGKYVDTQDLWFTEKALLKIYKLDIDL
jgi:hypothetical protein